MSLKKTQKTSGEKVQIFEYTGSPIMIETYYLAGQI